MKTDAISASSDQIAFGLDGDDVLLSTNHFSTLSALIGGAGHDTYRIDSQSMAFAIDSDRNSNDTYILGYGSRSTIFDNGGVDQIRALSIGFNDPYTYTATVDNGNHLIVGNLKSLTHFMLPNWRNPFYEIEHITLSDGTYSSSFLEKPFISAPTISAIFPTITCLHTALIQRHFLLSTGQVS